MATPLRDLIVSVTADTTNYQREMDRAARMGEQYFRSVQQGEAAVTTSWDRQTSAARTHASALEASKQAVSRYAGAAAEAINVGTLIGMADDWGRIGTRIRVASASQEEFTQAQTRLMEIANRTYRDYGAVSDQFATTAQSMRSMGFAATDTLDAAEALGLALVAGGSSAQFSASANDAWVASMAQGRISTEQLQTLLAQTPRVVQALEEGLGKTTQELQEMAETGQLTAQVVVPALTSQMGVLRGEVEALPVSVEDAGVRFRNELQEWVGRQNEATGATQILVRGIEGVTEHLDALITIGGAAGLGAIAGKMAQIGTAAVQSAISAVQSRVAVIAEAVAMRDATAAGLAKAQADLRRAQAAMTATRGTAESGRQATALANALLVERQATLAAATAQAQYARATNIAAAAGRGALAILGGPAGLALTLGTVAAGWLMFRNGSDDAGQALIDLGGAADDAIEKFAELNQQQQAGQLLRFGEDINASISDIRASISNLTGKAFLDISGTPAVVYRVQMVELAEQFEAGALSANEFSARIAALNQELLEGKPAADKLNDIYVRQTEVIATNAREIEKKRVVMATLANKNTESGNAAAAAAGKFDQEAGAIRGLGQAAVDVDAQLRGLDTRLNAQIVNLVRIREGAEKAMMVEIGQQINAAGGVAALTPEQRASYNQKIASQRWIIRQTEAAQAGQNDRADPKAGDQWQDYSAQMERSIALQSSLAEAYGRGEAAVAASNRQHEIEEQVLRFGERHRQSITQLIEREAEARASAEGGERLAALERQIATYGLVGNAAKMAYETARGALANLSQEQRDALNDGARFLDWLDENVAPMDGIWDQISSEVTGKQAEQVGEWSKFASEIASNVQASLGENLKNALDGNFSEIGDSFVKMLKRIAAEYAASRIWEWLGTSLASFTGQGAWGSIVRGLGGAIQSVDSKSVGSGLVSSLGARNVTQQGAAPPTYSASELPESRGTGNLVTPLLDAAGGGMFGSGPQIVINNNTGQKLTQRQQTQQGPDGQLLRQVIVDIGLEELSGGAWAAHGKNQFGWREAI